MPYTLLKFLLWFGLAALIGGVIGWLLRSLQCRAEIANARSVNVDDDDVDRMRHRLANLEQVVAERDRLRMQVADLRAADSPGVVGASIDEPIEPADDGASELAGDDAGDPADTDDSAADDSAADDSAASSGIMPETSGDDSADADDDAERPTTVAGLIAVPDPIDDDGDDDDGADDGDGAAGSDGADGDVEDGGTAAPALDLAAAARAIGKKITLDDLTVVEGIGPKISELCRGIGIETWRGLADTDSADLRAMLDAAGPRYQIHKPETWPRQAELLATGQWEAFVALTDELDGGR